MLSVACGKFNCKNLHPMLRTRMRRILWSSKSSKRFTFLTTFLIFATIFGIVNYYQAAKHYAEQRRFEDEQNLATHVFIPRPVRYQAEGELPVPEPNKNDTKIAVVVMSATRSAAVKNHVSQLLKYRKNPADFPIIISQDGDNLGVTNVIQSFVNETAFVNFIHHKERTGVGSAIQKSAKNYFFIAQHYKFALDKVFNEFGYKTAIITEDDLDIAEDFFSYFQSTRHLLYDDPSIWCISAWNDNGAASLVDRSHSEGLYRTDFFPGLGWMLTSETWNELSVKWPEAYWDDWLRRQDIRRNRVCIRPEVSRTAHNNKLAGKGSSNGMYKKFLASIGLPDYPIDFSLIDMERLKKKNYDPYFGSLVLSTKELSLQELLSKKKPLDQNYSYRVLYKNPKEYRQLAKTYSLMIDIRSGMARTAYYGIVPFRIDGAKVYAVHGDLDLTKPLGSEPSSKLYSDEWDKMTRYLDFAEFYCKPSKWRGKCDPNDPEMILWFKNRGQTKRLKSWGEMIVI
uniref:Alpha-1,3-mannosyl-glycoprotein 2-beta-N-acetylglucosaminyltransferase n=1 Tax=Panagrolaimus sp. JU765 TaxID=591449 RepID=A0AC34RKS6_9BILA